MSPYASSFRHEQEVVFADDTPEAWHAAISGLLDRPARRDEVATGLLAWVAQHGVISATGPAWAALTRLGELAESPEHSQ